MPKLKNVTAAEIKALQDQTDGILGDIQDIADRIEKGYCDEIAEPAATARHFNAVARAAQNMVMMMLIKLAMQEQKAEIEKLYRQKAANE